MKALIRLVEVLERKLRKKIQLHEIGYETISLMREEIDDEIIPNNIILSFAEPVVFDSANYTDDEGNYYTLISIETGNLEPYEVWMVNDKVIENFIGED